jgi:small-conductance mechanosensitive channel
MWLRPVIIALIVALLTVPAAGQVDLPQPPQEEEPEQTGTDGVSFTDSEIGADDSDAPADDAIERRLRSIFAALPGFEGVQVDVAEGVVSLTGQTRDRDQIGQAAALAERLSGVVAVDNQLAADVSVDRRLQPAFARARELTEQSIALLPLLAVAVVVVLVFWIFGALLSRQAWLWQRVAPNQLVANLFRMLIPIVFVGLGLVIALNILDAVAVLSAVLGAAGVLGLAVGFAVRDSIENFIASIMLSLRQPFRANDLVEIDGHLGHVVRLTSRATILMTPDGNHLRIPNANVFKALITNFSRNPERRMQFQLGIDAEDDPQAGIDCGLGVLRELDYVLDDPPPNAWIDQVGDSNIVLTFAPWIDQRATDFMKARSAAIRAVKIALEEAGFTLPEPIYRLRFDQVPASLTETTPREGAKPAPPRSPAATAPTRTDVEADATIARKVEEDRRTSGDEDLLSDEAPTEYGDRSGI